MPITISDDEFEELEDLYTSISNQLSSISTLCTDNHAEIPSRKISDLQKKVQAIGKVLKGVKHSERQQSIQVPWWEISRDLFYRIYEFHELIANVPRQERDRAVADLEVKLGSMKVHFSNKRCIKKFEYTGSAYEGLKIRATALEFDVMFIFDGKYIELVFNEGIKEGYGQLRPSERSVLCEDCDDNGYLDPNKDRDRFFGYMSKWLSKAPGDNYSKLRGHGPATQLDIYKDKQQQHLWYSVDFVPCFELSGQIDCPIYVPKPLKNDDLVAWRKSYSLQEKKLIKDIGATGGCQLQVTRVVKAIIQLHENGSMFRQLTSYHIKTVLFHIHKDFDWDKKLMGVCVLQFMSSARSFLEKKRKLPHFFCDSINLLEDINDESLERMGKALGKMIDNEDKFWLCIENIKKSQKD